jgi:hypothetical protein
MSVVSGANEAINRAFGFTKICRGGEGYEKTPKFELFLLDLQPKRLIIELVLVILRREERV